MQFNCHTAHGPTLTTAEEAAVGSVVKIEWGAWEVFEIKYTISVSKDETFRSAPPLEEFARAALSHFDRTDGVIAGQTLYFRLDEIEPNGRLRLDPVP